MENTVFSVFAYGGSTGTASKLITTTKDIDEVNKIIAADMDFKKGSAACPMSYSTNFIDDGSRATVTKSTEYVKTTVEKREQIEVEKIFIEWGGGCRTAWIEITVDDNKIIDNTNCSSHSEYNFGC